MDPFTQFSAFFSSPTNNHLRHLKRPVLKGDSHATLPEVFPSFPPVGRQRHSAKQWKILWQCPPQAIKAVFASKPKPAPTLPPPVYTPPLTKGEKREPTVADAVADHRITVALIESSSLPPAEKMQMQEAALMNTLRKMKKVP